MADSSWERDPIDKLADEFLERQRRGESPSIDDYAVKYPDLAEEIRDLFPALVMMEELKPSNEGTATNGSAVETKRLERLGDYRILREVGRGGMGIVYEAEQESLGRRVALKLLPAQALLDSRQHKRFQREAKAAARLHHTNIVPVFGVGAHDGMNYYVMQFIHGLGLDQVLKELNRLRKAKALEQPIANRLPQPPSTATVSAGNVAQALLTGTFAAAGAPAGGGPEASVRSSLFPPTQSPIRSSDTQAPSGSSSSLLLPGQSDSSSLSESGRHYWHSVARIGIQVADALDYAHSQGVLHRDIKPSNLLLDNQGTVWVTDFGLAKGTAADGDDLTHTGDIVGTLRYMAPERFQGQSGAGGDIYSLGLTLYEMLALRPAFNETDHKRLIQQVTHEEPPRPRKLNRAIPRDLETIILKATEREPGRRYQTPKAMAEDLQRFVEDKPIRARQAGRTERLWRWCRRNPALATSMTVAAAAMITVTVFAVLFAIFQARNAEDQARANNALSEEKDRAEKLAADLAVALKDTRNHEALLAVEKGHMLIGQGQLYPGMLWLCRGLEKAPADAAALQDSIRTSLAALRSEAPVLRLVLSPGDGAKAAAFRPDGKAIVVGGGPGGGNGEARLWDAITGKPLGPPLPHPEPVHVIAFSPNGTTVLTGSGIYAKHTGQARLWDAASGKLLLPPMTLADRPWALGFSPDGKRFVTGTADFQGYTGEIRLWDTESGKPLSPPLVQAGPVYDVAFSPDGKSFAAASWNPMSGRGVVGFWDAVTAKPLGTPYSDNLWIGAIGFAPDGNTMALGIGEPRTRKGEVRFLDIAGHRLVGRPLPHTGIVSSVAFSPDGQLVLTGSLEIGSNKGDIRLWEAATGKLVGMPIPQQGTLHAGFSPDGRRILSTGYGKSSYVWELPTDRLIGPLLSHHEPVSAVAFTPDGKMIATGSGIGKRGVAQRWDAATGKPIGAALPQPGYVLAVTFSPDGSKLLTGTGYVAMDNGEAQLWDASTGKPLGRPLPHGNDVTAVAFSPDAKLILTGSLDQTARLWDAVTSAPIGVPLVHPAQVTAVAFSPDGKTILTGCKQSSYEAKARTAFWDMAADFHSAHPSPKASFRALGVTGPNKESTPRRFIEHQGDVKSIAFSPDGKMFATGCADRLAQLWNAASAKPVGLPFDHPDEVAAVAFSPDGKLLLTGCIDKVARIWDVRTGLPVGTGLRHPESVTSVAFSGDGQSILTGCRDGLARVWDAATLVKGDNARLLCWVEVQSGTELSPSGAIRALSEAEWQKRQKSLAALGGPLESRAAPLSWHLQEALRHVAAADWSAALWQLDRHVHDRPDDALARALRAKVNLELNQAAQAAADFDRALALGPPDMVLPSFRAFAAQAIDKKQKKTALWYLDRLVQAEPQEAFGWLERGRLYAAQGRWQEAAREMARGVDLDPSDHWNWFQATTLQLYSGDSVNYRRLGAGMLERFGDSTSLAIAERTIKDCLLAPNSVPDPKRLSQIADRVVTEGANHSFMPYFELVKGMADYRAGRFVSAVTWLTKRSTGRWDRSVPVLSFLAMAYHHLGESDKGRRAFNQARALYEQLPKAGDENFPDYDFNGWVTAQIVFREAASYLEVPHRRDAEEAVQQQNWQDAVTHLTHLIDANPRFWPDRVARSCAYAELGRKAEAEADFACALELTEQGPSPWRKRGYFHRGLKRHDQAAADFVHGLEATAGLNRKEEHTALLRALLSSPRLLDKALEMRPQNSDLWVAQAQLFAKRDEWAKALSAYERALELKPDNPILHIGRGRCLARLGRWQESAAEYARGMESCPENTFLWHEAAMTYLMAGQADRYRNMCETMLKKFGNTDKNDTAQRIVYTLMQTPRPVADMDRLLRLADQNSRGGPGYGAALYRCGRLDDAVKVLEQKLGSSQQVRAWARLFLAMAHARLGHAAVAKQHLAKADAWIAQAERDEKLYLFWVQRLEFQVLRREAAEVVRRRP